jgi:hypothetical protein
MSNDGLGVTMGAARGVLGQDSTFGALRARAAFGCGCLLCYRFAEGSLNPGMA